MSQYTDTKPANSFKDLRVWRESYRLSLMVYKITSTFPNFEKFGLGSQMCRASVSVCSNIAEGFGRRGNREKDQFYAIAKGSVTELENQLLISQGVGYIGAETSQSILNQCDTVQRMLYGLQKSNQARSN